MSDSAEPEPGRPSLFERLLGRLEKVLRERSNPEGLLQRSLRRTRAFLLVATIVYLAGLGVVLFALMWFDERQWLVHYLLLAPASGWLVPLVALAPPALLLRPGLCWAFAVAIVVVFFVYQDFRWTFPRKPDGTTLTLITGNIGQRKLSSLEDFLKREDADIVALQDARGREGHYKKQFPDHFVQGQSEFVLVSKWPIIASGLLPFRHKHLPVAAWFEVDYRGIPVVVYNVHLPTPRPELIQLRGRGFLVEIVGRKGIHSADVRRACREAVAERIELARQVAGAIARDERPVLVPGDFNMTSRGYLYTLFAESLSDAFARAGRGYGYTFPGTTRNPLTLFGPWARLDYIFAGNDFRPVECRVEPRQPAQHRAVLARLEVSATLDSLSILPGRGAITLSTPSEREEKDGVRRGAASLERISQP